MNSIEKKSLAYYGGKKSILYKKPHYKWPPDRSYLHKEFSDNLLYEKNKTGYPKVVEKLELDFKNIFKAKFCISTNSGTSALFASFYSLKLNPGDEIIVPNITFHATATPLLNLNCKIVFADCDLDTGNISLKDIAKKISNKTKAVVVTHLCGHPCNMIGLKKILKDKKIKIIEDCSHAHLSKINNKLVGTFGDMAIFSMDTNKILSVGEGGILLFKNKKHYIRALSILDFGDRLFYENKKNKSNELLESGKGFKNRIHPYAAFLASKELKKLKLYIKERHKKLNYLSKKLENIPGISPPITYKNINRGAYYSYRPFYNGSILNDLPLKKFIKIMQAEGAEIRQSGNPPLHLLPIFQNNIMCKADNKTLVNSIKFYNNTFSLPTFTFESYKMIDSYVNAFVKVCNYFKNNKSA